MTDYGQRVDFDGHCGKQVGRGFITYPCRLDKGHPASEPCVAPEIPHSLVAHREWERSQPPEPTPEPEPAPETEPEPAPEQTHSVPEPISDLERVRDLVTELASILTEALESQSKDG